MKGERMKRERMKGARISLIVETQNERAREREKERMSRTLSMFRGGREKITDGTERE